ncbi:hypothetical protein N7447_004143 [Penicillium robsamsonii]|uniref:uncharacterized protein n=1 Tax=Penicillium robsamsonii TaxID=1792511 RepID=UPI0025472072|nr:uncharacterized protein N7447_004143 [Penicillium robsamsonii]KAJ5827380.1 hypothetical protein N7447_004143 [Penicillium robsamsonii]
MLPELPMLTMGMDPSEWCRMARKALHPSLLHFLLDISIIHPKPSDENWPCWSALVYGWFCSNMERDIQDLLAGWLYNAINTMRNNHNAIEAANQWRNGAPSTEPTTHRP